MWAKRDRLYFYAHLPQPQLLACMLTLCLIRSTPHSLPSTPHRRNSAAVVHKACGRSACNGPNFNLCYTSSVWLRPLSRKHLKYTYILYIPNFKKSYYHKKIYDTNLIFFWHGVACMFSTRIGGYRSFKWFYSFHFKCNYLCEHFFCKYQVAKLFRI